MRIHVPDELKGQKILVTGGAGAIGSRMVKALSPLAAVTVVDDLSSGFSAAVDENCRFIQGSITESRVLHEAFEDNPTFVIHLAANFANQNSVDNPEKDLTINGHGTLSVLQAAERAGVAKLVYSSSSCVYGSRAGELNEAMLTLKLDTPYGVTKLLGEYYVNYFAADRDIDACSVRYFNAYGPSELPGAYRNVIPNFIFKALNKQALTITGDGTATRDFTYIDDIVNGTLLALTKGENGEVYNVGTGTETTIKVLAESVNALTENPEAIHYKPRRGWDRIEHRRAGISKSNKVLGYSPQTEFQEGLATTVDWFRENWNFISGLVRLR